MDKIFSHSYTMCSSSTGFHNVGKQDVKLRYRPIHDVHYVNSHNLEWHYISRVSCSFQNFCYAPLGLISQIHSHSLQLENSKLMLYLKMECFHVPMK